MNILWLRLDFVSAPPATYRVGRHDGVHTPAVGLYEIEWIGGV